MHSLSFSLWTSQWTVRRGAVWGNRVWPNCRRRLLQWRLFWMRRTCRQCNTCRRKSSSIMQRAIFTDSLSSPPCGPGRWWRKRTFWLSSTSVFRGRWGHPPLRLRFTFRCVRWIRWDGSSRIRSWGTLGIVRCWWPRANRPWAAGLVPPWISAYSWWNLRTAIWDWSLVIH